MLALSADRNVGVDWRRGRVAEGTSLLRMHMAYTRIVGSNPTVSARKKQKAPARELFPLTPPGDEGAICMAPSWDSKGCPYLGSPLRIVHLLCATRTAQRAVGALPIHIFAVKHAPQRPSSRKARRPQPAAQAEPVSQRQTRPPPLDPAAISRACMPHSRGFADVSRSELTSATKACYSSHLNYTSVSKEAKHVER